MIKLFFRWLTMRKKLIIACDFDGTIVKNEWPCIGPLRWWAVPVIKKLQKRHELILWTCREGQLLHNALALLLEEKIYCFANCNSEAALELPNYTDSRKVGGHLYIDDMGAGFWCWPLIPLIVYFREKSVIWYELLAERRKDLVITEAEIR
jgi:hypothetical protein